MRQRAARIGLPVDVVHVEQRSTIWLLAALTAGLLFLLDLVVVETGSLLAQDRAAELWVHHRLGPGTYSIFAAVSNAGSSLARIILIALLLLALLAGRRLWTAAFLLLGAAAGPLIEALVNAAVARPRPHLFAHAVAVGGYSFPSGHATGAGTFCFTAAVVLAHVIRRSERTVVLGILAVICTALVALSRVVLGVHYPSDVIGGCLFATAWVSGCIYLLGPLLAAENGG